MGEEREGKGRGEGMIEMAGEAMERQGRGKGEVGEREGKGRGERREWEGRGK